MKIIEVVPMYNLGSIGKIASQIQSILESVGDECIVAYSYRSKDVGSNNVYQINSWLDAHCHNRLARITKWRDSFSFFHTLRFIRYIEREKPDIIHLHLIQENYLNMRVMFKYLNKSGISVIWTFHDCRAFTGGCPYFLSSGCQQWKESCEQCVMYQDWYAKKITHRIFMRNKKLFSSVPRMEIVTPSAWLKNLVQKSFLSSYSVRVINNGIDLQVFSPKQSAFREKHGISEKYILLGVAFGWGYRKGLDCFCELAQMLDNSYQIVLVGTNESVDDQLPSNIISIHRTTNAGELAEIYSSADLFVNPTREDNFPTTNIEALACGIPVVTFDTGGSPEIIDESCGAVVPCDDMDALVCMIEYIKAEKPYSQEACLHRAQSFNKEDKFREYISLYHEVLYNEENCDRFA